MHAHMAKLQGAGAIPLCRPVEASKRVSARIVVREFWREECRTRGARRGASVVAKGRVRGSSRRSVGYLLVSDLSGCTPADARRYPSAALAVSLSPSATAVGQLRQVRRRSRAGGGANPPWRARLGGEVGRDNEGSAATAREFVLGR